MDGSMMKLKRYKEILFGLLLGAGAWIVDAAMHVQLSGELHATGDFWHELFQPNATALLFRSVFLIIAAAFGWSLWRSNWRERELRALEGAIISFHRRLDSPAMRIVSHIRMLQGRPGVTRDDVAAELVGSIGEDAHIIDDLAKQYIRFSEQVMAGHTNEAINTLRLTETRGGAARTYRSLPPGVR